MNELRATVRNTLVRPFVICGSIVSEPDALPFQIGLCSDSMPKFHLDKVPLASISLHIGVPKTATSYIQGWLHKNRRALRDHGVFVPGKPIFPHRIAVEHLIGATVETRADVLHILQTPFEAALLDLEEGFHSPETAVAIVSSEYFYLVDAARACGMFRARFGVDPTVVVYIRSQADLILSGYNQAVKRMGQTAPRPRPSYETTYDWRLLLDAWANVIGKERLRVISFDVSARHRTILQDFVAAACPTMSGPLEAGAFEESKSFNESLSADLLEFKRLANLWGEFGLETLLNKALSAGYRGPRFGASQDEARKWRELYEASNAYVAKEYFSGVEVDAVFPDAVEERTGVDFEGRLPIETLARLFALGMQQHESRHKSLEERIKALEQQIAVLRHRQRQPTG